MDGYLEGSFELAEFQEKKNKLMAEKKDIEEKLSDFERKGNHWLELTRNWILEANQAKNLALQEDFSEMKNFQFLNFAVCGECGYSITAERHIKKSGLKFVYYRCTHKSKTQNCSQTHFLREEVLTEQVKENCQKVSLPDDWREKYLTKVNEWEKENSQSSNLFAQNLKIELSAIKIKIDRLMDGYLEGGFELAEFQEKKNKLMAEKKDIEEKLSDFERKGNHWLELTRNWILEANQAKNLILSENFSEMKNFLKTIGSNRRLAAGKVAIGFKNPWDYLAEKPAEASGEAPRQLL